MQYIVMKKILFYGDSNTYGYDPADFFGGSYPTERIWTSILAERLKGTREVINCGENGRRMPDPESRYIYPASLLSRLTEEDVFAIMLGANDLLIATSPDADLPVRKMEQFLLWFFKQEQCPVLWVMAPPSVGSNESGDPYIRKCYKESLRMNEGYARLAGQYHVLFTDTSKWEIPFAYDEIHFSEQGHALFAERLAEEMERIGLFSPGEQE